jgi:isoaspartyl peptidase/L-asparaginase-like protein (Ntn-hydrolase superfamily)
MVIATWPNEPGVRLALEALQKQASPLDAVETGVRYVEADPNDHSVGYGGLPDARGRVTLDACIMDEQGNAGSVLFLQHIMHPVTVARMVMEQTPHVILCGAGALDFALSKGFRRQNLLTPQARKMWNDQRRELGKPTVPPSGANNHDTIGMITLATDGRMAGACSTSGLSNKLPGRVGDSPIIGAGLYVDPEVGGATATGMGEHIIKAVGSFLIVELMRQGASPTDACREAVRRINKKLPDSPDRHMVGFVALRKDGVHGAFANNNSFKYTIGDGSGVKVYESDWV